MNLAWKIEVARQKLLVSPLAVLSARSRGVELGTRVRLLGMPIVSRVVGSRIRIEDNVTLVSNARWTALGVARRCVIRTLTPSAEIRIGTGTGLSGATICAAMSVNIGKRVLVGADVMIADTDFHPLDEIPRTGRPVPQPRAADAVVIEDDVFIGTRAIVLRGARIGRGSVIGAGSIVTSNIPAGCIAAGSPARVLRKIQD
jgi:acetyltransferase-like isoleucine patch superfamily enzyme